jgi:hypothetical protein
MLRRSPRSLAPSRIAFHRVSPECRICAGALSAAVGHRAAARVCCVVPCARAACECAPDSARHPCACAGLVVPEPRHGHLIHSPLDRNRLNRWADVVPSRPLLSRPTRVAPPPPSPSPPPPHPRAQPAFADSCLRLVPHAGMGLFGVGQCWLHRASECCKSNATCCTVASCTLRQPTVPASAAGTARRTTHASRLCAVTHATRRSGAPSACSTSTSTNTRCHLQRTARHVQHTAVH